MGTADTSIWDRAIRCLEGILSSARALFDEICRTEGISERHIRAIGYRDIHLK